MSEQIDVLVIGGGPAGLATGIALAEQGIRTLVCERNNYPVDKACGEGLMPTGLAHLTKLGVTRYIAREQRFSLKGIRYISPGGQRLESCFAEGPGLGMRREVLSAALFHRAGELPCLEVRAGCPALPIARSEQGVLVEAGGQQVQARLLIGADGLNSGVRSWAGLQGPRQNLWRWGGRQHFQVQPWSEFVEVYWQPGIEAYVTPCAPDVVGIGFLWEPQQYGKVSGGSKIIASLLPAFPELEARLQGAEPLDRPRAVGPLQRKVKAPLTDRVLLVGDAAGYLDALTGEGLSLAFGQACAAAQVIARLVEKPGDNPSRFSAAELQPYGQAYRKSVRAYYLFTHLALFFSRHTSLLEVVIPYLQRRPALFQALLSASMGRTPSRSSWTPEF